MIKDSKMIDKKVCILFAGAIGSSKSPIAAFLSGELGLPVFSNDSIRTEISEDFSGSGEISNGERGAAYIIKRDERLLKIIESGKSFILDASIDRRWELIKLGLEAEGYRWFIISLDLGKEFLTKLYKQKDYAIDDSLNTTIKDHDLFKRKHAKEIGLHISNKNFKNRMKLSLEAIREWEKSI